MATPQENLEAAFPLAVNGQAVLDEETGDYWVYEDSEWNNVGPLLGDTVLVEGDIRSWNETAIVFCSVKVGISPYPEGFVNGLNGVPTLSIPYGINRLTASNTIIYIKFQAFEAGSAHPPFKQIQLLAPTPQILQGIVVNIIDPVSIDIINPPPSIESILGVFVQAEHKEIIVQAVEGAEVQTEIRQIFATGATISITPFAGQVNTVSDPDYPNVTLLIKSIGQAGTSMPIGRFFPDLSGNFLTVRVTEYTDKYYTLSDAYISNQLTVEDLPAIGSPFRGGYYAGLISHNGNGIPTHALIVAPAATGASGTGYPVTTNLRLKTTGTDTPGTYGTVSNSISTTTYDGATNTSFMTDASHPAGSFCSNLTIGGYNDWYLPAPRELSIIYENLKPTTDQNLDAGLNSYAVPPRLTARSTSTPASNPARTGALLFQSGQSEAFPAAIHWTSQQVSSSFPNLQETIEFLNGTSSSADKTVLTTRTRAIRKEPLLEGASNYSFVSNLSEWTDGLKGVIYSNSTAKFGTTSMLFHSKTSWLQATYDPSLSFGTNPFTMEGWVRFNELTLAQQWLFNNLAINSSTVELHNSVLGSANATATAIWSHGGSISVGQWIHLAITRDVSNTIRLFVNGLQVDTGKTLTDNNFTIPVYKIGAKYYSNDTPHTASLKAFVQEIRITKNVARYVANFTPPDQSFDSYDTVLPQPEPSEIPESSVKLLVLGYNESGNTDPKDYSSINSTITATTTSLGTAYIESGQDPFGSNRKLLKFENGGYFSISGNSELVMHKQPFCVEFWLYLSDYPAASGSRYEGFFPVDGHFHTSPRLLIDWDNAKNEVIGVNFGSIKGETFALGSSFVELGNQIKIKEWVHIAYSRDSLGEARLFVNGKLKGEPQFLHSVEDNYIWTDDGYQNFTGPLETIGTESDRSGNFNRRFTGYIADLRITKGYARYLSDFSVPTSELRPDIILGNIELFNSTRITITGMKPVILTGSNRAFVLGASSASGPATEDLVLPLPAGTNTNDVTFVVVAYPKEYLPLNVPTLLGADGNSVNWMARSRQNFYIWTKSFTASPSAQELSLKIAGVSLSFSQKVGGYIRVDNAILYQDAFISLFCPTVGPNAGTIQNFAERTTGGIYQLPAFNTACFGTYRRTDYISPSSTNTWITAARGTSGTYWMHCGTQEPPADCCTNQVCGSGYDDVGPVDQDIYRNKFRVRVGYVKTNWSGTYSTAGDIATGGNEARIYPRGFGYMWNGVNPASPLTVGGVSCQSYYSPTQYEAYGNDGIGQGIVVGSSGQIEYLTMWESVSTFPASGVFPSGAKYTDYIPAFIVAYSSSSSGNNANKRNVGIVSTEVDTGAVLEFNPKFIKSSNAQLVTNTGLLFNNWGPALCSASFRQIDTLFDQDDNTYISTLNNSTSTIEWHSGSYNSGNYDCCTSGFCQGLEFLDYHKFGNWYGPTDTFRFTVKIVRTTWSGSGSPSIRVGGAMSTIQLVSLGSVTRFASTTQTYPIASPPPVLETDDNGLVTTYVFDVLASTIPGAQADADGQPDRYNPIKTTWNIVNGSDSSVGIISMHAQLVFDGSLTGPIVAAEGITGHIVSVRGTSSQYRNSISLTLPSNPAVTLTRSELTTGIVADGSEYYSDYLSSTRENDYLWYNNNSLVPQGQTNALMPVPFSIGRNALWINITSTNESIDDVDFDDFPASQALIDVTSLPVVGETNVSNPASAIASRLSYGTRVSRGGSNALVQAFTDATSGTSLSINADAFTGGNNSGAYISVLESENAWHENLKDDPNWENALIALGNTINTQFNGIFFGGSSPYADAVGRFRALPLCGLKNPLSVRSISAGNTTLQDRELIASVNDVCQSRGLLFNNFNLGNPTISTSFQELYQNDWSDYSIGYGLKGNPVGQAHIRPFAYKYALQPGYDTYRNQPTEYTNLLIAQSPTRPEWRGGTRKTCRTEYFGLGENFYGNQISRAKNWSAYRPNINYGSQRGPAQTNFYLRYRTTGTVVSLQGETGYDSTGFNARTEPFFGNAAFSYNIPSGSWFNVSHLEALTCLGVSPSNYRRGFIGIHTGRSDIGYSTYTSPNNDVCRDNCSTSGLVVTFGCYGHLNVADAYLKGGMKETVNPAYSSARIGALTHSYRANDHAARLTAVNQAIENYNRTTAGLLITKRTSISIDDLPQIGDPLDGGYYVGLISHTANSIATHALIAAPVEYGVAGQNYPIAFGSLGPRWAVSAVDIPGAVSVFDGKLNTDAILTNSESNHPAALFCRQANIDGYTDWYLPAPAELSIAYFNLKPGRIFNSLTSGINAYAVPALAVNYLNEYPNITSVLSFRDISSGDSEAFKPIVFWSSRQSSSTQAWSVSFNNGSLVSSNSKTGQFYAVRAFRRILIDP